jgi:hypothetical protein
MKKILLVVFILLSLVLVACDSSGSATVDIENVNLTSDILEADLKIKVEYESNEELMELVTSAVNLTYAHYKEDFGTEVFTLYFTVYAKDATEALGVISYKVNDSKTNPGLTYIGDNLS